MLDVMKIVILIIKSLTCLLMLTIVEIVPMWEFATLVLNIKDFVLLHPLLIGFGLDA